jgi:hypothetical protein
MFGFGSHNSPPFAFYFMIFCAKLRASLEKSPSRAIIGGTKAIFDNVAGRNFPSQQVTALLSSRGLISRLMLSSRRFYSLSEGSFVCAMRCCSLVNNYSRDASESWLWFSTTLMAF